MLTRMVVSTRWFALAVLATACGDNAAHHGDGGVVDTSIDAPQNPSCAFNPPPAPTAGSVELGAVDPPSLDNFTVVMTNDNFQTYEGPQGGYHLWIDARVQNIDPGDGSVATRPQTKFNIYTQDGARVDLENCAYHLAYHAAGSYLYLSQGWLNEIVPTVGSIIDDTPLRLKVEVLDRSGNYAIDERWVKALAPIPTPIGP